jgi:hypothetical protein
VNILAKECVLKWPDKEEPIAHLDARITAMWKEGATKGTGHGYFMLIKGRVPCMHEVREKKLMMHLTGRDGSRYVANATIATMNPVERPGEEVDIRIDDIEQVE